MHSVFVYHLTVAQSRDEEFRTFTRRRGGRPRASVLR
jgi:hypothetical protein